MRMLLESWQADSGFYWAQWSKSKGYQRDCFDMCSVVQHTEDTARQTKQMT